MCQSNEKGSLSFSMWQRSQACLTVHARFRLSVLGYLYSTFSYERRASCCAPTCASGEMMWTPRVSLSSGLTRRPLGGPPTSRAPHLTRFHPRCFFLTTPSFHSPVVLASARTSSLLPRASSVGTAVREIGFYSRMYAGTPHSYKQGAGGWTSGPDAVAEYR